MLTLKLLKQWWRETAFFLRTAVEGRWGKIPNRYPSFSSLAEAHNNLGLALQEQGRFSESRGHFSRAVKLEPRHTVYRNVPPFRRYGDVPSETESEQEKHSGHRH